MIIQINHHFLGRYQSIVLPGQETQVAARKRILGRVLAIGASIIENEELKGVKSFMFVDTQTMLVIKITK